MLLCMGTHCTFATLPLSDAERSLDQVIQIFRTQYRWSLLRGALNLPKITLARSRIDMAFSWQICIGLSCGGSGCWWGMQKMMTSSRTRDINRDISKVGSIAWVAFRSSVIGVSGVLSIVDLDRIAISRSARC